MRRFGEKILHGVRRQSSKAAENSIVPTCPCCGGTEFCAVNNRPAAQCVECRSVERTRVAKLFLEKHVRPEPHWRVLHLAPEIGLAKGPTGLIALLGDNYEPADFDVDRYQPSLGRPVAKIDLRHPQDLPRERYDLVIHNHVLEHVPANWTLALQALHAALVPGGVHLFSVPMRGGYFREDLDLRLTEAERTQRFFHPQHMRVWGRKDLHLTLGPVLGIKRGYKLLDWFSAEELARAAIQPKRWNKPNGASVFMVRA